MWKKIIIFKHSSLSLRAHLSSALLPYRQTCLTGTFYRYKSLVIIEHQLPYSPSGNPIIKWSTYVSQSIFSPPLNKSWWHHLNLLLLILTQMIQTKQYDKKKYVGGAVTQTKKKKRNQLIHLSVCLRQCSAKTIRVRARSHPSLRHRTDGPIEIESVQIQFGSCMQMRHGVK